MWHDDPAKNQFLANVETLLNERRSKQVDAMDRAEVLIYAALRLLSPAESQVKRAALHAHALVDKAAER